MSDRIATLIELPRPERTVIDRLSTTYSVSPGDVAGFCVLLGLEAIEAGQVNLADYLVPVQIPPSIEIDLTPELAATVDRLAAQAGLPPDDLVARVIEQSYEAFQNGQLTLADLLARFEEDSNG